MGNRMHMLYKWPIRGCAVLLLAICLFGCLAPSAIHSQPADTLSFEIVFLDVGQGDAIFVRQDEHTMLIDAGPGRASDTVLAFLHAEEVKKLDILVGTHPHEDHIGGMAAVIDTFDVGTLYMPKAQANTKVFEELLDTMARNGVKAKAPVRGDTFWLGQAECTVWAPGEQKFKDLNNQSIVLHMRWGETSFLFCGDAEKESEEDMLASEQITEVTVLKVAHHGSSTSSTPAFLDAVRPSVAVISLSEGNSYGHPHRETLQSIEEREITLYRTDQSGNITMISDGKEVTVTCQK